MSRAHSLRSLKQKVPWGTQSRQEPTTNNWFTMDMKGLEINEDKIEVSRKDAMNAMI
jgi:hypothetical protein